MSILKKYLKTKPVCKATFTLEKDAARDASSVNLVGDFNNWDQQTTPMRKQKDGSFAVTLELEAGREYQFRYLIDSQSWENDWNADRYAKNSFGDCDNSVICL